MSSAAPALPQPGERVVVAMSGGVDSSVAAGLLVEQGYEVVGISMRLANERPRAREGGSTGCCSLEDFRDAERVAEALDISHYTLDLRESFENNVIRPFVAEYLAGRTPSPCILCNREIKFNVLHQKARTLGAAFVATGHYAIRDYTDGQYRLRRGRDHDKDQSYFLFELGQRELRETLFPLGDMTKTKVRGHAARLNLPVAEKAESQEICFVPNGGYAEFVESRNGGLRSPEKSSTKPGKCLGNTTASIASRSASAEVSGFQPTNRFT